MRAFIVDHLPLFLANWLSLGIGITNRRGNIGSGLGGSSGASTAGQPIGLLLVLTKAS